VEASGEVGREHENTEPVGGENLGAEVHGRNGLWQLPKQKAAKKGNVILEGTGQARGRQPPKAALPAASSVALRPADS